MAFNCSNNFSMCPRF